VTDNILMWYIVTTDRFEYVFNALTQFKFSAHEHWNVTYVCRSSPFDHGLLSLHFFILFSNKMNKIFGSGAEELA